MKSVSSGSSHVYSAISWVKPSTHEPSGGGGGGGAEQLHIQTRTLMSLSFASPSSQELGFPGAFLPSHCPCLFRLVQMAYHVYKCVWNSDSVAAFQTMETLPL